MKKGIVLLVSLLLAGCAGTVNKPIDRTVLPTLKGKSVALVTHESPSFIAMTSGKGMFAVAGVGAAAAAGNKLVKDCNIEDPAPKIGNLLSEDLSTRYGLAAKGPVAQEAGSKDVAEIVKLATGSDYALDVATNGWSFMYDGFKFSDYHVGCNVKMQLIDVASATPISQGVCAYSTKLAGKPAVAYEKLLENDAAYIKQTMEDAAAACAKQFKAELF